MKHTLLFSLVTISLVYTPSVFACGESLYRVGKGVTYREYTAPLPGTILIVAKDETERLLAEALERAGHEVQVVAQAQDVKDRLSGQAFDIVMSRFEHRGTVGNVASSGDAQYLPVARHGTEEVALAKAQYPRSLTDDDHIKRFLIQIHRTLKARQA